MNGLEKYARIKLQCGNADFSLLDNVFSELSEDAFSQSVIDLEETVQDAESMNGLLEAVYNHIRWEVAMYLIQTSKSRHIKQQALNLINNSPIEANLLDTYFNNDLDQTISWSDDVKYNARKLWKYWLKNKYTDSRIADQL